MADLVAFMKAQKAKIRAELASSSSHVAPTASEEKEEAPDFDLDVKLSMSHIEESEMQYFKEVITEQEEQSLIEAVERQALKK